MFCVVGYLYELQMNIVTGTQLGVGRGGGLPCPFLKIKKSALILEKNAQMCSSLG